jgi:hypothetical protein
MLERINEMRTIIKFMPSNKFLTSECSKNIILMNKVRYFYSKNSDNFQERYSVSKL